MRRVGCFRVNSTLKGFAKHQASFVATIKIYPCGPAPDQRNNPARNGIRWAFCFEEDYQLKLKGHPLSVCDIWPEFLDKNGNTIIDDRPLIGTYNAKMHILFKENAEGYLAKLRQNPKFYCIEFFAVAEGIVTEFL